MATDNGEETDVRKLVFAVFALLTVVGVVLSMVVVEESQSIPPRIYVFGFLGATVYVFTSLAEDFDEEGRYALEVACKGIAAFPLAAGVYLLAFAFPATDDGATVERIISGLVFLSGAYVSLTLQALGGLASRMLGVSEEEETEETSAGEREETGEGRSEGATERTRGEKERREGTEGEGEEQNGDAEEGGEQTDADEGGEQTDADEEGEQNGNTDEEG